MQQAKNTILNKIQAQAKTVIAIILISLLTTLAVNFFFVFDNLAPGGLTGLALVLARIIKLPIEYMVPCITIPLFIIGSLRLGASFGIKTLSISLLTSLMMRLVAKMDVLHLVRQFSPILAFALSALIAGVFIGISISISIKNKASTGGTDLLAALIKSFFHWNLAMPKVIALIDTTIIVLSGIINRNIAVSFWSFISLRIIVKTIEKTTRIK
ncbi:YitT family protein [Bulleidia sp. zg-1006]|uniref:YitT family protein n=1 Tax=Bulleidia sp. zg-1006 TaxID=2806552 RepID=UPI0019392D71|nr:YitT family protein [Bulleidia sp. zg-1006]QRG86265.1 YitT family protein [Bulleidia sp. zg-1006]